MEEATTGVVDLFWNEGWPPFLLGGLGFFGAIVLLLFDVFRKWLYALAIPYTLAHIAGWLARGMPNFLPAGRVRQDPPDRPDRPAGLPVPQREQARP